jgi:hypothetical protein
MTYYCKNYDTCHNCVRRSGDLCEECKAAANKLTHAVLQDYGPTSLSKNEGLRRHPKSKKWVR